MINLPAAPAVPVPSATGAANLPAPAANGAAAPAPAAAADAASSSAAAGGAAAGLAGVLLDAAAAIVPAPFGALLDAMADATAGTTDEDSAPAQLAAGSDTGAAAQAVATLMPAMGNLPPAALPGAGGVPGATPDRVAAVAAALTAPPAAPAAGNDNAMLLRQQAQANALLGQAAAAPRATAAPATTAAPARTPDVAPVALDTAAADAGVLDARAAMLAATARQASGAALPAAAVPAAAAAPAPAPAPRASASDAINAALQALQGQSAGSTAAPVSAKDAASLLADSQPQNPDTAALPGFRSVLANTAASQAGDTLHLTGNPEQWQQPLRAALGDRLQLQLARNDERAVIRLEPPNMGSVEISVRHSGGALQVNIAASHSEVLRQLNTIGDAVRQDLSQRQFGDVAVTVSSSSARNLADGGGQQRQQQQSGQQRQPGMALADDEAGTTTFAMLSERE